MYDYNRHAVKLTTISNDRVFVDEDISLLISELNRVGFVTKYSCQGGSHFPKYYKIPAYITFDISNGDYKICPDDKTVTIYTNAW